MIMIQQYKTMHKVCSTAASEGSKLQLSLLQCQKKKTYIKEMLMQNALYLHVFIFILKRLKPISLDSMHIRQPDLTKFQHSF